MSLDQQISAMVQQLPEKEKILVFELVRRLVPNDDDVATAEDLAAIAAAREAYRRGDTVPLDSIPLD